MPPPPPSTNGAVFNMEWTDLRGRDGRYTGETDESGEPHGMGSVRYADDGTVVEGEWYHGELERMIRGLNVRSLDDEYGNNNGGQGGVAGGENDGRSMASNRSRGRGGGGRGGPVPAGN